MNKRGLLIVVSAPSGCGKGTILGEACKKIDFSYSISATTRQPREGEQDGVNYYFLTREKFEELRDSGGMLEWAEFCGNFYGTPKAAVEEHLANGEDVLLEIELNGAMQIKKAYPKAVLIFILPPTFDTLRHRLNKRRTETDDVIEKRLAQAKVELTGAVNYDYVVVNGELDKAVDDFIAVIRAEKMAVKRSGDIIAAVLE